MERWKGAVQQGAGEDDWQCMCMCVHMFVCVCVCVCACEDDIIVAMNMYLGEPFLKACLPQTNIA